MVIPRGRWTIISLALLAIGCLFAAVAALIGEDNGTSGTLAFVIFAVAYGGGFWGVWRGDDRLSRICYLALAGSILLAQRVGQVGQEVMYPDGVPAGEQAFYYVFIVFLALLPIIPNEIRMRKEPGLVPVTQPHAGVLTTPSIRTARDTPGAAPPGTASTPVAQRLRRLETLKADGMLTDTEYQTQRDRILKEI